MWILQHERCIVCIGVLLGANAEDLKNNNNTNTLQDTEYLVQRQSASVRYLQNFANIRRLVLQHGNSLHIPNQISRPHASVTGTDHPLPAYIFSIAQCSLVQKLNKLRSTPTNAKVVTLGSNVGCAVGIFKKLQQVCYLNAATICAKCH
jgi:hypothetical protein